MRVLFIGGTGEISLSCVEAAVRSGHQVTLYNRGKTFEAPPSKAAQICGDFRDEKNYAKLARDDFDVVCQFIAFEPQDIERDIRLFADHCGQYIFISTASVYKKPLHGPLVDEEAPLGNPYWAYSRHKQACEALLLAAHASRDLPVTIVRPSHTYRTRLPSVLVPGDHLAWRLLNGKPVIVPGDGEAVWTLTHADDFARAFIALFGLEAALGERFNITDAVGHTWNRIIKTVAAAVGVAPDLTPVLTQTLVRYEPAWEGPLLGDKSNSLIFDTRKIASISQEWRCEIDLEAGVELAWRYASTRLAEGYAPDPALDALIDRIVQTSRRERPAEANP